MKTHLYIEKKSLYLAKAIVEEIESRSIQEEVSKAIKNCEKWLNLNPCQDLYDWREVLTKNWKEIRAILLGSSEESVRLRQSNPFSGVLSNKERWKLLKSYKGNV